MITSSHPTPLKKLTVKFTGDEQDDSDVPTVVPQSCTLLARLSESAANSLKSAYAKHFGDDAAIIKTLSNIFGDYKRIVRCNHHKAFHINPAGGLYVQLTPEEVREVGQGVLEREFEDIIGKRRAKILKTIASRFPGQANDIQALCNRLISTYKIDVDKTSSSKNFTKLVLQSLPNKELDKITLSETDVFALNKQIYHVTDVNNEPQPIHGDQQLQTNQIYEMHANGTAEGDEDEDSNPLGPCNDELSELKHVASSDAKILRALLASGLLRNRYANHNNVAVLLTGSGSTAFVDRLQKLAHTYANAAVPLQTLANANAANIGPFAIKHIRRLTILTGGTGGSKMVSRALTRLKDHQVPTLPIVVAETSDLAIPDGWKVLHLNLSRNEESPSTPTDLLQFIVAGLPNSTADTIDELQQSLPTAGQLKAQTIRLIVEQYVKTNNLLTNATNDGSVRLITPLSKVAKSVAQSGSTEIDQCALAVAFESLGFSVTKPQNVYHVAWFVVKS